MSGERNSGGNPNTAKSNNTNPLVVKANAYDNYNNKGPYVDPYAAWKIGGVTPVDPSLTNLGQTSRAFALTHGAEAGLGINADPNTNPLAAIAHLSGVTSRGGTLPTGPSAPAYTPLTADLSKNPYATPYDQLLQFVKDSTAARGGQYDTTKATLQAQQDAANKQLYDAYQNSRQGADASATALHVDPAIVSATRDLMMRKNQENSDQSLAGNLAWLDKNRVLESSMLNTTANSLAQEKTQKVGAWNDKEQARIDAQNIANLQAMVKASTGGSGKGGGKKKGSGGGGKSSSSGNVTATETQTLQDGGLDKAFYDQLASTNPTAAALYLNQHLLNQGTPEVKSTQGKINDLAAANQLNGKAVPAANIYMPQANAAWNNPAYTAAQKAAQQKALYEAILPGMITNSGLLGNPKTVQTVKNTAKGKA